MRMDIEREAKYLEASIRRLISAVRRRYARPEETEQDYGWWVLACGEPFGDAALAERDVLRDRLRAEVEQAGIMLPELIWVWDEDDCVQLVITTLPTQDRAERVAERLRAKGLRMRVARERF
ncbi:hypothetical protein [Paucidesulfovibrio longus]|uniref:hypothetical protein n=1 Tax=Paucidesulfovibrio longus TaxID=889 RepID=UPI0003B6373E|nr:hypothetical protein [Paucidesulfovibrio longus]